MIQWDNVWSAFAHPPSSTRGRFCSTRFSTFARIGLVCQISPFCSWVLTMSSTGALDRECAADVVKTEVSSVVEVEISSMMPWGWGWTGLAATHSSKLKIGRANYRRFLGSPTKLRNSQERASVDNELHIMMLKQTRLHLSTHQYAQVDCRFTAPVTDAIARGVFRKDLLTN